MKFLTCQSSQTQQLTFLHFFSSHRSQCCKMRLFIMICNHFVIRVNKVYLTKYGERVKEKRLRLAFFLGLQSQMARLYQKPLAQYSILATEEYYTWAYNWVLRPVMVEPPLNKCHIDFWWLLRLLWYYFCWWYSLV